MLLERIELSSQRYQRCVINHSTKVALDSLGLQLFTDQGDSTEVGPDVPMSTILGNPRLK